MANQTVDWDKLARTALEIRRDIVKMLGVARPVIPGDLCLARIS